MSINNQCIHKQVTRSKTLKENHITSSNFVNYEFLIKTLRLQQGVVDINAVFPLESRDNPLRVDIVANNGLKWIKVIARNSRSIEDAAKGCVSFGARSVLDQAADYLEASELHYCMFQRPKVRYKTYIRYISFSNYVFCRLSFISRTKLTVHCTRS